MARGDGRLTHDLHPRREGPAGRLRRLRRLGPRRGGRQAHLLRPLRAAAPRAGVGRHRHQRRRAPPGLQGHGPGLPGLRRARAQLAQGPPRGRPLPLLHHRRLAPGRTPSPPSAATTGARSRWPTTATSPTPPSCATCVDGPQRRRLRRHLGGELRRGNTTDTALVTALLADDPDRTLEAAALDVLPQLRGAFCFVFMDEHTLYAARDPHGHPPAGPRPARARLGRGQRDRGPGHRRAPA